MSSRLISVPTARRADQHRGAGINMHEDYEVRDWSKRLGVTPQRLKQLVKEHGPMAEDVRKALGKQ